VTKRETDIRSVSTRTYAVPTDQPEADGTLSWGSTTVVVVEVVAGHTHGLGWTYASEACRSVIDGELTGAIVGDDVMCIARSHENMVRACRNLGRPGVVSCAISAVDIALWDCKAKTLGCALSDLFGACREAAPIYGSGGFTTYDDATAAAHLERWTGELQIPRVKIKVGESWGTMEGRDLRRAVQARRVIGDQVELYVDANGAYRHKQAVRLGQAYIDSGGVSWFEEPVSSDDLAGLRLVREELPLDVAAGEYGYDEIYFDRMLGAQSVDCLQIDVTRCGGYTSWLRVAAMAAAKGVDVSAHCAPNLHAHVAVGVPNLRHIEYFWDHERIEQMLFDGSLAPAGGSLTPDRDRPGHGLSLREHEAELFRC
jgi:L-alanine-DL-glutamate epimerase-like enolase superfamily enzyme